MPITRLNHAVLFVGDLDRSVGFYTDVLGFRVVPMAPDGMRAAFLQAEASTNDHDLGLFEMPGATPAVRGVAGLYHLAWEVETLGDLERLQERLAEVGALVGATDHGTTKSLYARDPDGIELEIAWIVPADLLTDETRGARARLQRLDLRAEKERYGTDTRGGVGVSVP